MADNQTRRVIEVQSDLYQKGNLEREATKGIELPQYLLNENDKKEYVRLQEIINDLRTSESVETGGKTYTKTDLPELTTKKAEILKRGEKIAEQQKQARAIDLAPLSQYNDPTAHFRMVREEIKKAAEDGKTKLQFPTGETAMKIEGLGESRPWQTVKYPSETLSPNNLKTGTQVLSPDNTEWIVTDVLGDGKFKAIQKNLYNGVDEAMSKPSFRGMTREQILADQSETFDISGKVDTNNPIYKFYEKDLGRYLSSKYGAKTITDENGVKWYEVAIDKKKHGVPVEAFAIGGIAALGMANQKASAMEDNETLEKKDMGKKY
jgi:hypothetical protein